MLGSGEQAFGFVGWALWGSQCDEEMYVRRYSKSGEWEFMPSIYPLMLDTADMNILSRSVSQLMSIETAIVKNRIIDATKTTTSNRANIVGK